MRVLISGVVALLSEALLRATPADVLRSLESPALPVRAAAIDAARNRWLMDAIPALCRLRADADSGIRRAAGAALTAFEEARKERL